MQVGFRRDNSTDDANFLMLRPMELAHRWQHFHIYFLFPDWIKCYDRIHHAPLLDALRRFGLPPQYLRVLESMYDQRIFVFKEHKLQYSRVFEENVLWLGRTKMSSPG